MSEKKENTNTIKKSRIPKRKMPSPFQQIELAVENFINDLDSIIEMFEVIEPILMQKDKERSKRAIEILESIKRNKQVKDSETSNSRQIAEWTELDETLRKLLRANTLFRQNVLVSAISRYDHFIGEVFRGIFRATPDRLKNPDKTLSYDEILQLDSIDNAIEKFINKEVEQLLRESHATQIEYFDKNLKLDIKNNCPCWSNFIEVTERRNLFVHTGGIISQQYLQNCSKNGFVLNKKYKVGIEVSVDEEYLKDTYKCLLEISLRISQFVLRNLWPDQLEDADSALNDIGFNYLLSEQWDLALIVFNLALSLPRKSISNDAMYKIYVINKCIALKWAGDKAGMLQLLDEIDWSAADSKFVLGILVLKDEYEKAETLMETMNGKEPIEEHGFRTWPIFRVFRDTEYFKRAYQKIYGKEFVIELPDEAITNTNAKLEASSI